MPAPFLVFRCARGFLVFLDILIEHHHAEIVGEGGQDTQRIPTASMLVVFPPAITLHYRQHIEQMCTVVEVYCVGGRNDLVANDLRILDHPANICYKLFTSSIVVSYCLVQLSEQLRLVEF